MGDCTDMQESMDGGATWSSRSVGRDGMPWMVNGNGNILERS